jgi:hypothetical protein
MMMGRIAAVVCLLAASASAGEMKLMHCFAWTSIKEATPADWEAFFKASDALPSKIAGISHIWYGKLASPLSVNTAVKMDNATFQKLRAGETVPANLAQVKRDWGMCMEMKDAAALKAYDTDPYHKTWTDAYSKIRVDGTTTFDILGQ